MNTNPHFKNFNLAMFLCSMLLGYLVQEIKILHEFCCSNLLIIKIFAKKCVVKNYKITISNRDRF